MAGSHWRRPGAEPDTGASQRRRGGRVVRANLAIFEDDYWALHGTLTELLRNANAQCVLLIDRTGQLISSQGAPPDFDITSSRRCAPQTSKPTCNWRN